MAGVDFNPVAWFVTKNELACSDPGQVKALFEDIEAKVKPLVQPFYTTTCPRGHMGRWVDRETGKVVNIDPAECSPDQRSLYRWEGPGIIYTFWAKHGPCNARGCNHRTPIFRSPVIAEKKLTSYCIPSTCPSCSHEFNIELGETRMAPGVERVVLDNEPSFTETSQEFAQLIKNYSKGNKDEKQERIDQALEKFELFQDLDRFNLGDYKRFDDEGRGMQRLLAFAQRAARLDGGEFLPSGKNVFVLNRPNNEPVRFTTDRDKALLDDELNLLGLEHPVVRQWLDAYTSVKPQDRALIGTIDGNGNETGLITVWLVVIYGKGGQIQQRVVRLGISEGGGRSPYLERLSQVFLRARPALADRFMDKARVASLVNGTASELLHRELVYSGFLPEEASYSSRLLACIGVAS